MVSQMKSDRESPIPKDIRVSETVQIERSVKIGLRKDKDPVLCD